MKKQGILTVISGFSGAGKGTVVRRLLETHPEDYCLSVSATTRSPRENEEDGVHYFFISTEKFEEMIEHNELLEYARYVQNYYGTPKHFVTDHLSQGINVVLEIEMQGALQVKKRFPECLLIFITPPTAKELEDRLRGRGSETEEVICQRLLRAKEEAVYMNSYDYIVINKTGEVDACVEQIHQMIEVQQQKAENCGAYIQQMTDDLKSMKIEISEQ